MMTDPERGPRERLARLGPDALADAELLAIVLGTGLRGRPVRELAADLLRRAGGLAGALRLGWHEWQSLPGLGPAKAARVLACFTLGRRAMRGTAPTVAALPDPEAALTWLQPELVGRSDERLVALLLDGRRRPLDVIEIARGDPCRVMLTAAQVFRPALLARADAMVLAHNHPGGDPTPSRRDLEVTQRLRHAGTLLGVEIEAHFVVAGMRWAEVGGRGGRG